MSHRVQYGNRMGPKTWDDQVPKLAKLFSEKTVVSMNDMRKATGKKWVRGFLTALSATVEKVVPVKVGRTVIGYRYESKPLEMTKNGSFRGPDGRFVTVAASKPKKAARKASAKASSKETTVSEMPTAEAVAQTLEQPVQEAGMGIIAASQEVSEPVSEQVSEPVASRPMMVDEFMPAFLRKA